MPKKALASLNVVINAVTSPLFRGLKLASKRLIAFGTKMKAIGRSISMSFTLPFAMVGVAGAKMAIDFEKNMTKINTLVGISAKEVNELGKEVMKLSGETAQAPEELADGLFFLTSAGLRGANALKTLEAVAKGTAIGLGDQADLAKVAAAAQNAYGAENLSAAKALDIFGGAVREGMFEAGDLAQVLGTQLGMSSSLGISFEETAAFIATYTKTTGDAKAASTSFGGVMMALAKTTPQMERALNKVGMTGDSVRKSLGEKGLKATLEDIKGSFEASGVPLTDFFSKSQALKGVLGVLGNQTENYGSVLEGMSSSVGMVEEGFGQLEQQTGFKMQKAFNNLKLAASELGATLMPVFTAIVEGASSIGKAFTSLDGGTKKLVVGAGALLAFSGPLMTLAGGIVSAIGAILSPIGLVVVALGAIFYIIYNNWGKTKTLLANFINYFIDLYNESMIFRGAVQLVILVFKNLWAQVKFTFNAMKSIVSNLVTTWIGQFKAVAKVISAALKIDPKGVKEGAKDYMKATKEGITNSAKDIKEAATILGDEIAENISTAIENTMSREKIEFVTEEDIQGNVDAVGDWFSDKLGAIKKKLQGFMGGSTLLVAEGGDPEAPEGGKEGDDPVISKIADQRSALQKYLDWASTEYEGFSEKVGKVWGEIAEFAGAALNGIGNLFAAQSEKAMTLLENEQSVKNDALAADFEREALEVENSTLSQEVKDDKLAALAEKFGDKQDTLDKKMDLKKKALQKKAAVREKGMKIAQAIMGTAQAVVQALTAGPIAGPILAGIVGTLGAAQIATIASTPIALAKGGLAFGPTQAIVGDNPNAANDPEVIAPLSKLKNMLGTDMNVSLNVGGIIKGNDIYLSNTNTNEQRERYI